MAYYFFNRSDRNELYIDSVLRRNYFNSKRFYCLDLFHYESSRTEKLGRAAKIWVVLQYFWFYTARLFVLNTKLVQSDLSFIEGCDFCSSEVPLACFVTRSHQWTISWFNSGDGPQGVGFSLRYEGLPWQVDRLVMAIRRLETLGWCPLGTFTRCICTSTIQHRLEELTIRLL